MELGQIVRSRRSLKPLRPRHLVEFGFKVWNVHGVHKDDGSRNGLLQVLSQPQAVHDGLPRSTGTRWKERKKETEKRKKKESGDKIQVSRLNQAKTSKAS